MPSAPELYYSCPCCYASAKAGKPIKHSELCSYNNTKNAVLEFPPEDFILGVQNPESRKLVRQYKKILGRDRWQPLEKFAYELTASNAQMRSRAFVNLVASTLLRLGQSEIERLEQMIASPHPNLFMQLRNFLLYKAVSHAKYQELHDEFFRWQARRDAMNALFSVSLFADLPGK